MTRVDVLDSLDAAAPLADEWNALADRCQLPMLDHDWCAACAESLHRSQRLQIVSVRDAGRLTAVAPLVVESGASGSHLTVLGAARLYEPCGWLFATDAALETLTSAVLRLGRPVLLHRVSTTSPLCRVLPRLSRPRAVTLVRRSASSFAVPTTGPFAEYQRRLSSTITSNLPRLRRKAERTIGPVAIERAIAGVEDVDAALDTLVDIEDSGWKGERGSSLKRQPDLQDFFRRYSRRAARRSRLVITTLKFGDTRAATELAIEAAGRHWQLKIAFLDRLAAYYPGLQLVDASIRAAFDRGLDAYEFLGSAERWEEAWRPEVREYRMMAAYPLTVAGIVGVCGDVASAVWRRAKPARPHAAARERQL